MATDKRRFLLAGVLDKRFDLRQEIGDDAAHTLGIGMTKVLLIVLCVEPNRLKVEGIELDAELFRGAKLPFKTILRAKAKPCQKRVC